MMIQLHFHYADAGMSKRARLQNYESAMSNLPEAHMNQIILLGVTPPVRSTFLSQERAKQRLLERDLT